MRRTISTSVPSECRRCGFSRVELTVVTAVVLLLIAFIVPWVLNARERSKQITCQFRMGNLAKALSAYENSNGTLPPAATWDTSALHSLTLNESKRWDLFIGKNWAVELLPYLGRTEIFNRFDENLPMCSDENRAIRDVSLAEMTCPADKFNRVDNRFNYEPVNSQGVEFGRGNYAINGGTNSFYTSPGSTRTPTGDHAHLHIDVEQRKFEYWGNGIAGFNKAFKSGEFANGKSSLVAFNEVRAGIDPIDIRGCWALGHIGASVTWGHGINGDAYCPNNLWARSDDIQGGGELNEKYGPEKLIELGMPCVSYIDKNLNATSRSSHVGGVNTAFLDGAVRFVSNDIDPTLWHFLHSREIPEDQFHAEISDAIKWQGSNQEASPPALQKVPVKQDELVNSIGMQFVRIPAGKFTMGVPDVGNNVDTPPETPAHEVQITHDYFLGMTEVTVGQFQAFFREANTHPETIESLPNMPVVDVTWNEAQEFCTRLSALPAERSAGRTYRLPTEAEWEYACRDTTSKAYSRSRRRAADVQSGETAGIASSLPLTSVASYSANSLGLHDMRGNAWEWCSDWFDRDYYTRSPVEDPAGPQNGYAKVVRGGDWIYVGERCFINYPILPPWKSSPFIGFRVVCVLVTPPDSEGE